MRRNAAMRTEPTRLIPERRASTAMTGIAGQHLQAALAPAHGGFTICWETSGSGRRTVGRTATGMRGRTAGLGKSRIVPGAYFAAVPGTSMRLACGPPIAAGVSMKSEASISAFGLQGIYRDDVANGDQCAHAVAGSRPHGRQCASGDGSVVWFLARGIRCDFLKRFPHEEA